MLSILIEYLPHPDHLPTHSNYSATVLRAEYQMITCWGNQFAMTPNSNISWLYAFACGLAGVLGASFVFFDLLFRKWMKRDKKDFDFNRKLLIVALSFGSGVMLYSGLVNILPGAIAYIRASNSMDGISDQATTIVALCGFAFGGAMFYGLDDFLHRCLPEDVVHCEVAEADENAVGTPIQPSRHLHGLGSHDGQTYSESSSLLPAQSSRRLSISNRSCKMGNCAGFSEPCCRLHGKSSLFRQARLSINPSEDQASDSENIHIDQNQNGHHHHVENSAMARVAIQTSIAMVHKVPEVSLLFQFHKYSPFRDL
jgi:zinc transporter ZupT